MNNEIMIEPPSAGWVRHNRPVRRANPDYVEQAGTYTETCHKVGNLRTEIIGLAHLANVRPRVTRQELRSARRHDELAKLGARVVTLLDMHDSATTENRHAMSKLRCINNSIQEEQI